jgi:hypothetical protein
MNAPPRCDPPAYVLRFEPVIEGQPAVDFPCDAAGEVDLDALGDAGRTAYFGARIVRGLLLAPRIVRVCCN